MERKKNTIIDSSMTRGTKRKSEWTTHGKSHKNIYALSFLCCSLATCIFPSLDLSVLLCNELNDYIALKLIDCLLFAFCTTFFWSESYWNVSFDVLSERFFSFQFFLLFLTNTLIVYGHWSRFLVVLDVFGIHGAITQYRTCSNRITFSFSFTPMFFRIVVMPTCHFWDRLTTNPSAFFVFLSQHWTCSMRTIDF